MAWRDRLSGGRGRLVVREHVAAAAAAAVAPPLDGVLTVEGHDALRVLLLGGGVAVGHGAADREDALDGQLARRLAAATGRGVEVVNLGTHDARLTQQVGEWSDAIETGAPELVLWCPGYIEMTDARPTRRWGRSLQELLERAPARRLVALELPVPTGSDAAAIAAAPLIDRVNRRLRTTANALTGLTVVAPPPVPVRPSGQPLFDPEYYRVLADLVLQAVPLPRIAQG